jgi:hypothetical protein
MLVSMVVHSLVVTFVEIEKPQPPPKDEPVELTLLAEPVPGEEGGGDVDATVAPEPAASPPPTPSKKKAQERVRKAPEVPQLAKLADMALADASPDAEVVETPAEQPVPPTPPTEAQPNTTPRMSFSSWMAEQSKGIPGLGAHAPRLEHGGGVGRDRVRSRGTKQCVPTADRMPEIVYLLIDSSGSMTADWRAQAISCAHQYARAAMAHGAKVAVGNFADRATFTEPTDDMTELGAALRLRSNGQGTTLPAAQLGPLFDSYVSLPADLVVLSDGALPNYREAMPWYQYFLDINSNNRGYLYTVGFEGPREVTAAFESWGFEVFVYRII